MRDPKRIDQIIEQLRVVWKANPDWRLGQVFVNAYRTVTTGHPGFENEAGGSGLFSIEDNSILRGLGKLADKAI